MLVLWVLIHQPPLSFVMLVWCIRDSFTMKWWVEVARVCAEHRPRKSRFCNTLPNVCLRGRSLPQRGPFGAGTALATFRPCVSL